MGITVDQVRRGNDKAERQLDRAGQASIDATRIVDGKVTALTGRVDDSRERLARVESTVEFLVTGQRAVIAQTHQTHQVVAEVHEQLETVNGLAVGELLDRAEGRRIQDIPKTERSAAEQNYVRNLEEGPNGH